MSCNDGSLDQRKLSNPPPPPHSHPPPCLTGYAYINDLWALEAEQGRGPEAVDPRLGAVTSPLNLAAWDRCLQSLPDQSFRKYILSGISQGFRVGFSRSQPLKSARNNTQSAGAQGLVIDEYLRKECELGRVLGPFRLGDLEPAPHVSRIGVTPKGHQQNKWRLIVDLSFPVGGSVNDGISRDLASLSYVKIDDLVNLILALGRNCLLAKLDIKSAFRIVPVHPADRHLLGMRWRDKLYVDSVLSFGLRSAPKIFNALADALEWVLQDHGVRFVRHYLDDFMLMGPPGSNECSQAIEMTNSICELLGVPLAPEK